MTFWWWSTAATPFIWLRKDSREKEIECQTGGLLTLTCKDSQFEAMGNCLDCLSPQPEVENPDPVSESFVEILRYKTTQGYATVDFSF